jgi:RHS repeat-associated protein
LRVARGDSGAIEAGVSSAVDLYPYGSEFAGAEATSARLFTGHERDVATGLDYMLARHSSSASGRFLTVDPSSGVPSIAQSWGLYAYVRNSPLGRIDPDGREDIRTDAEKAMMNDPDVELAIGTADLGADDGSEWGFAVIEKDGDYSTTEVRTDKSQTHVEVPYPDGAVGRFHTHRPGSYTDENGRRWYTRPNEASKKDKEHAQGSGVKGYIDSPLKLIRVVGTGQTVPVMTGKDWRRYIRAARQAAKSVQKARKAEEKARKLEEKRRRQRPKVSKP